MSCPEPSEEECSLIRFDLLNDECMKLDAEERWLFEITFACSAFEHDFACLPHSFTSNACPSDFASSSSSCAGSAVETPANRDTAKDYGNIVCSLELHDCNSLAFL